jgi:hypothetical protein
MLLLRLLFTRHCIHFSSTTGWELLRTELAADIPRVALYSLGDDPVENSDSIVETYFHRLISEQLSRRWQERTHCSVRYAATSSKHSYFYCCLRYNVFTESLPSNALAIHVTIFFYSLPFFLNSTFQIFYHNYVWHFVFFLFIYFSH